VARQVQCWAVSATAGRGKNLPGEV
jgi:hypothetical protein